MTFIPHTPEALLSRNDSKNPQTTCKGITSSGRPCRRSIGSSKQSPSAPSTGAAETKAGYCWQHQYQVEDLQRSDHEAPSTPVKAAIRQLQQKSSIDTLVARLGIIDLNSSAGRPVNTIQSIRERRKTHNFRTGQKTSSRPSLDPASLPVTLDLKKSAAIQLQNQHQLGKSPWSSQGPGKRHSGRSSGFFAAFCIGQAYTGDDYLEVVRHKRRIQQSKSGRNHERPELEERVRVGLPKRLEEPAKRHGNDVKPTRSDTRQSSGEDAATAANPSTDTARLLSLIPQSLSPQLTSLLLAELSKPISPYDEKGYIYVFWLTDEASDTPSITERATILGVDAGKQSGRRPSELLKDYATPSVNGSQEKKILLKIGRASNVHRRLNEWTRQCGYSLSLLRFYPYMPSTVHEAPPPRPSLQAPDPAPGLPDSGGIRKVTFAHRVERLIHIELSEKRVKRNCAACGKEHREWFEIEASRDAVRAIDSVVRRWVTWDQEQNVRMASAKTT